MVLASTVNYFMDVLSGFFFSLIFNDFFKSEKDIPSAGLLSLSVLYQHSDHYSKSCHITERVDAAYP